METSKGRSELFHIHVQETPLGERPMDQEAGQIQIQMGILLYAHLIWRFGNMECPRNCYQNGCQVDLEIYVSTYKNWAWIMNHLFHIKGHKNWTHLLYITILDSHIEISMKGSHLVAYCREHGSISRNTSNSLQA